MSFMSASNKSAHQKLLRYLYFGVYFKPIEEEKLQAMTVRQMRKKLNSLKGVAEKKGMRLGTCRVMLSKAGS